MWVIFLFDCILILLYFLCSSIHPNFFLLVPHFSFTLTFIFFLALSLFVFTSNSIIFPRIPSLFSLFIHAYCFLPIYSYFYPPHSVSFFTIPFFSSCPSTPISLSFPFFHLSYFLFLLFIILVVLFFHLIPPPLFCFHFPCKIFFSPFFKILLLSFFLYSPSIFISVLFFHLIPQSLLFYHSSFVKAFLFFMSKAFRWVWEVIDG